MLTNFSHLYSTKHGNNTYLIMSALSTRYILKMKKLLLVSSVACTLFSCMQPSQVAITSTEVLVPDTTWTTKVEKTKEEWKKILTRAQYNITREQGTELPFSSVYEHNKEAGI